MQFLKRLWDRFSCGLRYLDEAANPDDCDPLAAIIAERDRLFVECNRLRIALRRRDEMIGTMIDEYDQALAAEGKKQPAAGPAEGGI